MYKFYRITAVFIFLCFILFLSLAHGMERAQNFNAGIPVKVVKKIYLPQEYHEGLFYDNGKIWLNNGRKGATWIIDPEKGDIVSRIQPVAGFTEGLSISDDGTMWLTDWDEKALYTVKVQDNKMTGDKKLSFAPSYPAGLLWVNGKLYVITWVRDILETKYYLLEYDKNLKLTNRIKIKGINEPAHMAWDGKNLWVTSWYKPLVYKIDLDTLKVEGAFRSPAEDTTGIVWDGKYFWITGSYDNLYQVEVGKK